MNAFQNICTDSGWFTVKDLKEFLAQCPDHAMVCIDGSGSVRYFRSEPGANEPFVILKPRP